MSGKQRVLVIGAGAAGLAAATRLLEKRRHDLEVTLVHQGHNIGGKAASYRDAKGHTVEHGWHMILGFYHRMRALMKRAGVDEGKALVSLRHQQHVYEPSTRRVHTISGAGGRLRVAAKFLGFDGMPLGDRLNFGRFMAQAFLRAMTDERLQAHDDICFRTWAIEHGLRPHITRYSLFRFFQEAYFNFPESISAFHVLQSLRLMDSSEKAEIFVTTGGFSETIWQPIARYFQKLGGKIEPYCMATDWVYHGRRVTGVRVARPDPDGHDGGASSWKTRKIPVQRGSERVLSGFDSVISTIPVAVVQTMNATDTRLWSSPYFKRLRNIRSGATVSLTVHLKRKVMDFPGPVFGLPAPLGIATNMKPYWREYRQDATIGSAIQFVGQEQGFESWSDQQIIDFTLDNFSAVSQIGDLRKAGIDYIEFHRNRSDYERLMLCEPGIQQFRAGPLTPFHNLFVAGDWVRNTVDLICMEGAIASGHEAADKLMERIKR